MEKKGSFCVKFSAENRTKRQHCMHACGQRTQVARTLTTASANGCRACGLRPMEAISWKRASSTPLAASFQLVEKGIESFPSGRGLRHNHVLPQTKRAGF